MIFHRFLTSLLNFSTNYISERNILQEMFQFKVYVLLTIWLIHICNIDLEGGGLLVNLFWKKKGFTAFILSVMGEIFDNYFEHVVKKTTFT